MASLNSLNFSLNSVAKIFSCNYKEYSIFETCNLLSSKPKSYHPATKTQVTEGILKGISKYTIDFARVVESIQFLSRSGKNPMILRSKVSRWNHTKLRYMSHADKLYRIKFHADVFQHKGKWNDQGPCPIVLNPKSICHQLLRVVVKIALNHGGKYQVKAAANDIQFPGRIVRNTTRRSRFILRVRHGFYGLMLFVPVRCDTMVTCFTCVMSHVMILYFTCPQNIQAFNFFFCTI